MQPCRRRKKKGFTSIPFWPYGAFVNGRAEEITTFGGGRGAARLLTLVPLSSCLALIKMRCQPRMQMRFCGGGRGGSSPLPIPTSCQQMHGVSGEESHRRFHLNRNLFDKNIRPTRDGEVKAKAKLPLSLSLSLSLSFLPSSRRINRTACKFGGKSQFIHLRQSRRKRASVSGRRATGIG